MAATFGWSQTTGSSGSEATTDLGISGNLFNFKRRSDTTPGNYSTYPISAGDKSYEVWLRAKFSGTFNKIENMQFWRSTDFSPATGLSIKWADGGEASYATPVTGENKATAAIPTSDPGSANVSIGGNITGNLAASGYTDYIVLQLNTTSAAAAGSTSLCTMTLNYDES